MAVDARIRYEPLISAPSTVEELRFWAQNELRKVGLSTQSIDDVLAMLVEEAPKDNQTYGRRNGAWIVIP